MFLREEEAGRCFYDAFVETITWLLHLCVFTVPSIGMLFCSVLLPATPQANIMEQEKEQRVPLGHKSRK